jgi:O-antigen/teichoic acid export membrane protein
MVVPLAFLLRARKEQRATPGTPGRSAEEMPVDRPSSDADRNLTPSAADQGQDFSFREGGGFAAAVLVIMFSEQAFLNAGPLITRGLQGATAAGFIFNVLMIARAPLQLFQAVSTSILPHLTSLHTSTDPDSDREFDRSVRGVLIGVAGFATLTAIVVLIAGPKLMQIAFSDKFTYDRPGLLLVTLGMGLYLASVTLNQACLAQGQVRRAAARWIGCATLFIAWNFVPLVSNEFRRIEIGFALTAGVLVTLLYLVYRHPRERAEDVPQPGSPEELEARLAAIDENV